MGKTPFVLPFFVFCLGIPLANSQERVVANPFSLAEVKLLDGPFKHATELNIQSLLHFDPDRLLARFRIEAGLEPKAAPYQGWEAETLAGHSLGHHLSACALMFQTSGDPRFLERVNYLVKELGQVQRVTGNGYLGAMANGKKIFEEEVAKGNIRSQGFDLNGLWSPFYTHHKVLAGLLDAYQLCGNQAARSIASRFADWIGTIVFPLSDEQRQLLLRCEFGGIQEPLAALYAETGKEKYLQLARAFHHKAIVDPLAEGKDVLPGKHGNTQIPKLNAYAVFYELTGSATDRQAAEFFWSTVVDHHSYVTGGNGNHEYFGDPDKLRNRLSDGTTETCNVYNMLKLTSHLFSWKPDAKTADYGERALFNHILSTQHPETGKVIYNLSLEMGGFKTYQEPEWFTCCVGSGMETHSKYGGHIYYHNEQELYVNQYIASELTWEEMGLTLTQRTGYPEEQGAAFSIKAKKPKTFTLFLRYPGWAQKGMQLEINGKIWEHSNRPGSLVAIPRKWENGDQVDVRFPFSLRLESMPDDPDRVAVFYGPLVLAGDLGAVDDPNAQKPDFVPVWMSESRNPADWLEAVQGQANTFQTKGIGRPRDIVLKPFYQTHDRRYSVYFDLFNEKKWTAYQQAYQAEQERKKRLEAATFDAFQPGEMQPERDHHFRGDKLNMEENFQGRKARGAERGGWLSFEMNVEKGAPMSLVIEYWGGFSGSKTFDILVDDVKIATENISGKKDGEFLDVYYDIPANLIANTGRITVKFQPHEGHRAGPFFYARTVKVGM
ncbi:MAG: glycoside hydrolase family 127 protein [Haliscomenobacter sp.]|nr:glycoside hydrolase family 127 protein [Haliscomenobacter sp.]